VNIPITLISDLMNKGCEYTINNYIEEPGVDDIHIDDQIIDQQPNIIAQNDEDFDQILNRHFQENNIFE
jgi:hypothetical protein